MITAEDILCETDTAFVNDCRTLFEWEDVIKAMKIYANEKLDEAISKSFIFSEGTFDEEDKSFKTIEVKVVEIKSILSLKDQVSCK